MQRALVSGGEMAYVDEGEGLPVVLLHGFPTSSFLWRQIVPVLAERMWVIAPDLLGYGRSDKPADVALDLRAQAGYVQELLRGLGIERFAAVGHDTGGAVAQLLALEGGVDALGLVDSDAFDVSPIEAVRMLQGVTPEQETPEFVADVLAVAIDLGTAGALDQEVLPAYLEPFQGEEGARAFFRAVRAIDGTGLEGLAGDLAALDIPAIVIWGEDDPYVGPEIGERLADLLSRSTLVLLPGCSHFVQEDAADTVASLLAEFLRSRYLGIPHGPHAAGPVPIQLGRHGPA
jgi:2-hydroxymuconate-semialdehyde hydrolase